ncbi:MAG TPA: PSD1 and planctomycete cytochrome C domain-containing protein, partial [Vicinamibacteria bacterium]|nr:PSD1 and planctomycete cytochrome C domain-containing protein [Vicinamibacteria bacterium]
MDHRTLRRVVAGSAVLITVGTVGVYTARPAPAVDFARDVAPILERSCVRCHKPAKVEGGLLMSSRDALLRGGESGPAIVPGQAARSLLFTRLIDTDDQTRMPPLPSGPLDEADIGTIRAWIDQGAPWPGAESGATASSPEFTPVHDLFQSRCVRCHGPDRQENGLRLDTRHGTLRGAEGGPVVVPGKSGDSALLKRLVGQIEPRMPYEDAPLDPAQIALVRSWIDAGAPGPDDQAAEATTKRHWAYLEPVRPAPPSVKRKTWVRNPIDAFVLARLESEGLTPSPAAPKEALLRRVMLDLTGLPPTLEEVDALLADESPDAYERVVDRLLASPHYGERWARPWLDLARYADTHGYEKDNRRTAWKWRDWVIAAFNADMPFRQFTIEQMAGDMLKDATIDQRVATGFHRNTLLNQEGGIDIEEARWETLVDRVNTTATVWLGTTLACAQCHDHKFDPFSQKDYYRMLAFFDNGEYAAKGLGPRVMDSWIVEPELELGTPEQAARKKTLEEEIASVQARLEAKTPALEAAQATWERERAAPLPRWTPLRPDTAASSGGAALEVAADGTITAGGSNPDQDVYTLAARLPVAGTVTGLRLEAIAEPPRGTPGRSDFGFFLLTRLALQAAAPGGRPQAVALIRAEADEGSVGGALDDDATTGWGGFDPSRSQTAVFQPGEPLAAGAALTLMLEHYGRQPKHNLRRFRLSVTSDANPWGGLPLPERLRTGGAPGTPEQAGKQREALAAYYRSIAPALEPDRRTLRALRQEVTALGIPTAMVLRERAGGERPSTPLRVRGSYLAPGERVYAGVPAALPPLPEQAMPNRLGLALWLADESNPLTARVTVNRIWEQYFGRGLVETSEDFGTQGERPTHPELLDWLATEFQRQETRLKPLHRLIVTSATYRQSSRVTPLLRERDPYNRLLARGPRFRVEAEMVRDIALAAGGLLSARVGGPSVFPFQPDGIWDNPYSDDRWELSPGEDRYRRGLYTFVRRTAPYPGLTVFDAPSREFCTARRVRTNTPLQALTTLNDPVYLEAARALAARAIRESGPEAEARATRAFRLCTARTPRPEELAPLLAFHGRQKARFETDGEAARAVLAEEAEAPDAA